MKRTTITVQFSILSAKTVQAGDSVDIKLIFKTIRSTNSSISELAGLKFSFYTSSMDLKEGIYLTVTLGSTGEYNTTDSNIAQIPLHVDEKITPSNYGTGNIQDTSLPVVVDEIILEVV